MEKYNVSAYVHIRCYAVEAASAEEAVYASLDEGNYEIYDVVVDHVERKPIDIEGGN